MILEAATECILGHKFYFYTCKKESSNINNHFQIQVTNGYKWIHYPVKNKLHLKISYEIRDLKDISGFPQVAFSYYSILFPLPEPTLFAIEALKS